MSKVIWFLLFSGFVYASSSHVMVIDAGSTGSRLFIFKTGKEFRQESSFKEKKAGGIHTAAYDVTKLSAYLDPLIGFAKEKLLGQAYQTPIYFRATGGMRSLQLAEQQKLLKAVENYFKHAGFKHVSAGVISGSDEGIYAWIATNYLLKTLTHDSKFETNGVLDMGGASTQITFVPFNAPHQHGYELMLGEHRYNLYSYSYDGLGMQLGLKRLASQNCYNPGDLAGCQHRIADELRETCAFDQTLCGLRDVYQPLLRGQFIAVGGFAMLAQVFQLSNFAPSTLDQFGEHLCPMPLEEMLAVYKDRDLPQFLKTGCFEMAYYAKLIEGYGFTRTADTISAIEKIDDQTISIALGIAIYQTLDGKISAMPTSKYIPPERDDL